MLSPIWWRFPTFDFPSRHQRKKGFSRRSPRSSPLPTQYHRTVMTHPTHSLVWHSRETDTLREEDYTASFIMELDLPGPVQEPRSPIGRLGSSAKTQQGAGRETLVKNERCPTEDLESVMGPPLLSSLISFCPGRLSQRRLTSPMYRVKRSLG